MLKYSHFILYFYIINIILLYSYIIINIIFLYSYILIFYSYIFMLCNIYLCVLIHRIIT